MLRSILKGAAVAAVSALVATAAHANGNSGLSLNGNGDWHADYSNIDLGKSVASGKKGTAEWDVRVGGYYNAMVAYADTSQSDSFNSSQDEDDFDGFDVSNNAEIFFLPSITLDNGIKIGANIQLEGFADDARSEEDVTIDEAFLFIDGSFGQILLGNTDSAGRDMSVTAPSFFDNRITGYDDGLAHIMDQTGQAVLDDLYRHALGSTRPENESFNQPVSIKYFTPRLAGFQLGVSYARDNTDDENRRDCDDSVCDFLSVGANYAKSFGEFSVAASLRYDMANAPDNEFSDFKDPDVFGAGAQVGFGGFTIGGSFAEAQGSGGWEDQSYDIGVTYETGPWGFSINYLNGETEFMSRSEGEYDYYSFRQKEETETFGIGIDYKLAKGVRLNGYGAFVDYANTSGSGNGDSYSGNEFGTDGFVIGTGIRANF